MADDWSKLIADAKKLETKIKDLTLDEGKRLWKELQARDKSMEAHEKALQKAAIAAYEAGVGSKKVTEFMKDKGFAAAFKHLDGDRTSLKGELKDLETHCDKCKAAAHVVEDLIGVMDKALVTSKNKDKSAERSAAKKVRDGLYERFNDMNSASNLRYLPEKYMTGFDATFDKIVDHLIAEAFKKGKDPSEVAEVPQPVTEKKIQAGLKEAQQLQKTITTCLEKKAPLEPGDARAEILNSKAWAALDELRKVANTWDALAKKFKKELAEVDPKGDVQDKIKEISAVYDAAMKALKADVAKDVKLGKVVE